jgi:hypothetical protein
MTSHAFDPTPIPPIREKMSTQQELIAELRTTNQAIQNFQSRISAHLQTADRERSQLRGRLEKVESRCGVEKVSITMLTDSVRDLIKENKSLIANVAKIEGRQEGALAKYGKPAVGYGSAFFVVMQVILSLISGGKTALTGDTNGQIRDRDQPTIQSHNP